MRLAPAGSIARRSGAAESNVHRSTSRLRGGVASCSQVIYDPAREGGGAIVDASSRSVRKEVNPVDEGARKCFKSRSEAGQ